MHARVVIYKFKPGTIDEVTRKADGSLGPIYRRQAGFRSYEAIKTGPDAAISISTWDTEAHAQEAVKVGAEWVKANIAKDVVSAETHVGVGRLLSPLGPPLPGRGSCADAGTGNQSDGPGSLRVSARCWELDHCTSVG